MLLLGIDTSTFFGSIALTESDKVIAEHSINLKKTHSERLLPGIQYLLQETGFTLEQITTLAVTTGPGSFTGLRIGLSTAKAMAMATGKPLVGISTLDVLAAGVFSFQGLICAVLDARRGELYTALYRNDKDGHIIRVSEYLNLQPEQVLEMIHEPVLFVGNGLSVYGDQLRQNCSHEVTIAPMEFNYPHASTLCRLAATQMFEKNISSAGDLKALYIRPSDAELNRKRCESKT